MKFYLQDNKLIVESAKHNMIKILSYGVWNRESDEDLRNIENWFTNIGGCTECYLDEIKEEERETWEEVSIEELINRKNK